MYLIEELELSLVASEPRRVRSLGPVDVLPLGDVVRITLLSEDLLLLVDSGSVVTTLRDDRVKGLWKQNIVRNLQADSPRWKTLPDGVDTETRERQKETSTWMARCALSL